MALNLQVIPPKFHPAQFNFTSVLKKRIILIFQKCTAHFSVLVIFPWKSLWAPNGGSNFSIGWNRWLVWVYFLKNTFPIYTINELKAAIRNCLLASFSYRGGEIPWNCTIKLQEHQISRVLPHWHRVISSQSFPRWAFLAWLRNPGLQVKSPSKWAAGRSNLCDSFPLPVAG